MFRFFFFVALLLAFGLSVLANYDPVESFSFVLMIFGLIVAAVVLKVSLDFFLYYKEDEEEDEAQETVFGDSKTTTYYDLSEYSRAVRRRKSNT